MGSPKRSVRSHEQAAGLGQRKRAREWPGLGQNSHDTASSIVATRVPRAAPPCFDHDALERPLILHQGRCGNKSSRISEGL